MNAPSSITSSRFDGASLAGRSQRELMRLEVVGLSSEIATVAALIDGDLLPIAAMAAREIRSECAAIGDAAQHFLAPETRLDELSSTGLVEAVSALRDRRTRLMHLWQESKSLARKAAPVQRTRW